VWWNRVLDVLSTVLEHVTGCVFIVLTALSLAQVFFRYILHSPLIWSEELVRFLCVWLTFLGASALTGRGKHLRLGVSLTNYLPFKLRASSWIILDLFVLTFIVLLIWQGARFTHLSRILRSPALRVPMWWVWLAVPANGVFMLIFVGTRLANRFRKGIEKD